MIPENPSPKLVLPDLGPRPVYTAPVKPEPEPDDCHAIQRAKERYGLELTFADLRGIITQVRQGFVGRLKSNRHSGTYDVQVKGILCRVVIAFYDHQPLFVKTFIERRKR